VRIVEYPGAGIPAVLALEGRLDVRGAADARARLHQAVDTGSGDLVLDLRGLESWDATGLGVIMGTHRRAGRLGRRLVLRAVPAQLQRLLVATRLHRILAVEGAVADACGATLPGLAGVPGAAPLPGAVAPY
jgi:anti-anti-sigma factor